MKPATSLASVAVIGFALVATAGCTARAGTYAYAGTPPVIYDRPPTLVYVDSGVWVVRDSPYPVYYVEDRYWAYRDDVWYYSDAYGDGWTRVDVRYVPGPIVWRDHRHYVHYDGPPRAPTTRAPRPPPQRPRLAPASRIDRTPRAAPPPPPPPRRTPALRPPEAPPERMRPAPPVRPRVEPPKPRVEPPKPRVEPPKPRVEPPKPRVEPPKPRLEAPKRTPPRAGPQRPPPSRGDRR